MERPNISLGAAASNRPGQSDTLVKEADKGVYGHKQPQLASILESTEKEALTGAHTTGIHAAR